MRIIIWCLTSIILQITLTIAGPTRKLVEGSDVQFSCLTKANPPDVSYRWFVNDQFALSEMTSELYLFNITRRLHNSLVRCEAQNSVEKTEESKALNILCEYLPYIIIILATRLFNAGLIIKIKITFLKVFIYTTLSR